MSEKKVNLEEKLIEYEKNLREEDWKQREANYKQQTTKLERAVRKVSNFFQIDLPVAFSKVFKKKTKSEPITSEPTAEIIEDSVKYNVFRETYLSYLERYDESKIGTVEEFKNKDDSTTTIAHTEFGPILKTEYKTKDSTETTYEGFVLKKWLDDKYHFEGNYANVTLKTYTDQNKAVNDERYTNISNLRHYSGFWRNSFARTYKVFDRMYFSCKYWDEGGYYDEIIWDGANLPNFTNRVYTKSGYREGSEIKTFVMKALSETELNLDQQTDKKTVVLLEYEPEESSLYEFNNIMHIHHLLELRFNNYMESIKNKDASQPGNN